MRRFVSIYRNSLVPRGAELRKRHRLTRRRLGLALAPFVLLTSLCVPAAVRGAGALPLAAATGKVAPGAADTVACLAYCIRSVTPMGDGAIECGGGLTEVLDVRVAVGPKFGYAFPYVTGEARNTN